MTASAEVISHRASLLYTDACDVAREICPEGPAAMALTLLTIAVGIALAEQLDGIPGDHVPKSVAVASLMVERATHYQLEMRKEHRR